MQRPNPPGLFKDEAAPGQASSTDEADELDSETSTPELVSCLTAHLCLMAVSNCLGFPDPCKFIRLV